MQFDRNQIVDMLRSRGQDDTASRAAEALPAQVDTDQHAGLLEQLGLSPQELIGTLGGGGLGNLGGILGR